MSIDTAASDDPSVSPSTAQARPRSVPWQPIPGPLNRVSFFEEQARHRRATWRLTALCALTIVLTSIPFSAVIGPLVYAALAIAIRLVGVLIPLPPTVWAPFHFAYQSLDRLIENLDRIQPTPGEIGAAVGTVLILLSPGIVAIVLTWLWLRAVLQTDGVGGVLLTLGARPPRTGDLEEHQLVNVVEEMAIAAGLPPPKVMLLDAPIANAAAIGTSPQDATIVLTRQLLDDFDRDQTQGVLAHLIGSIGNGDLRIGMLVLSVFQTFGLLATVLDLPLSGAARASIWKLIRAVLSKEDESESQIASELLAQSLGDRRMSEFNLIMDDPTGPNAHGIRKILFNVRRFVFIPWLLLSLFGKMVLTVVGGFLLGPPIAFAWRTRRYLADATAVQLTRNPDGLARALQSLAQRGGLVTGGRWASHLFIVGGGVYHDAAALQGQRNLHELRKQLTDMPMADRLRGAIESSTTIAASAQAAHQAESGGTFADDSLVGASMHPPLNKRLERLVAQGATITITRNPSVWAAQPWVIGLGALILGPLIVIVVVLGAMAIGLITMLAFLVFEIGMLLAYMVFVPH